MTKKKDIIHRNYFKENNESILENGKVIYLNNPIEPEMIWVDSSTFIMGAIAEQGNDCLYNEKPAHQVTVKDFMIGKYQITQAQWKSVLSKNPSHFKGDNLPVECVSWDDVQDFISKLNALKGRQYRLPTEAEWEFAARGGNRSKGYKYSGGNNPDNVAWYYHNSKDKIHPVGKKSPNELGIYDMSGNVYEWCSDWCGDYDSKPQTNPKGPTSGDCRISRGGCWLSGASYTRASLRYVELWPENLCAILGFRLGHSSKQVCRANKQSISKSEKV